MHAALRIPLHSTAQPSARGKQAYTNGAEDRRALHRGRRTAAQISCRCPAVMRTCHLGIVVECSSSPQSRERAACPGREPMLP